jgi:hypothetical protein
MALGLDRGGDCHVYGTSIHMAVKRELCRRNRRAPSTDLGATWFSAIGWTKKSVLTWSGGLGGGGFQTAVHTGLGAALRRFCGFRDLDSHVRRLMDSPATARRVRLIRRHPQGAIDTYCRACSFDCARSQRDVDDVARNARYPPETMRPDGVSCRRLEPKQIPEPNRPCSAADRPPSCTLMLEPVTCKCGGSYL